MYYIIECGKYCNNGNHITVNKYTGEDIVNDEGIIEKEVTNLWDKIVDFKLVHCVEWDLWFQISISC